MEKSAAMAKGEIVEQQKEYSEDDSEAEFYGDPGIASKDAPVPRWLICVNIVCVAIGLFVMVWYWNGSHGWLDRGYWGQLQRAANTAYPYTTMQIVEKEAAEKQEAAKVLP